MARSTRTAVETVETEIIAVPQLRTSTQLGKVAAKAAVSSVAAGTNFGKAFAISFAGERKLAAQRSQSDLDALRAEYGL